MSATRTVHVTASQNLAALIDNVYGMLSGKEPGRLMQAIDDAPDDARDQRKAAFEYLESIGIRVIERVRS